MLQRGYTETLDNVVDSFRHFSWNYHLVDKWYVTRGDAKQLTDNHEFAEKGADYGYNNWPNSDDATQSYNGYTYGLELKDEWVSDSSKFFELFGPSSLMDFNDNEAGRGVEGENFNNNFDAFDSAVSRGYAMTSLHNGI